MSDTGQAVLIFLLLPLPLYIPIGVTIVAAITEWRNKLRARTDKLPSSARLRGHYRLRAALPAK